MGRYAIIVDRASDWRWPADGLSLMTVDEFLSRGETLQAGSRVVNLSRRYAYLSAGYYCSLLAEARGLLPMPTVADVLALTAKALYAFAVPDLERILRATLRRRGDAPAVAFDLDVFFGRPSDPRFRRLAAECFDIFRFPLLRLRIDPAGEGRLRSITPRGLHHLGDDYADVFLSALRAYTRTRRGPAGGRPVPRHSLAVLHEPGERLPPSDEAALERFERAAREARIEVRRITRRDERRLPEFDALFIRTTTAINHYTYRFACKAEQEGLVVIDDPRSILRCTNKVFLHELLARHRIPAPRSMAIDRLAFDGKAMDRIEQALGYPVVLKIPDGSFSRGMHRAENRAQLEQCARDLLQHSRLILAQEFMYTPFDWRVGVLGGRPLYLCQYRMSRAHWQIVDHRADGSLRQGGFNTLPLDAAPAGLLDLASQAARLIGDGLYGVDIKETDAGFHVIEVNDNPSIDHGVEDKVLRGGLYVALIEEFIRRIREKADALAFNPAGRREHE